MMNLLGRQKLSANNLLDLKTMLVNVPSVTVDEVVAVFKDCHKGLFTPAFRAFLAVYKSIFMKDIDVAHFFYSLLWLLFRSVNNCLKVFHLRLYISQNSAIA